MNTATTRALVLALSLSACSRATREEAVTSNPVPSGAAGATATATLDVPLAPKGRWRMASYEELDASLLWASHVLIRYRESKEQDVPFNVWPWRVSFGPSDRSREQALALAEEVAALARRQPERFGELVARYSEDVTTKDHGGALGGLTLSHYVGFPNVLDALAVTPFGAVTGVVETGYGFHVLLRRPPPPERMLAGAHVVIPYAGAAWLPIMGDPEPTRSREQALSVAQRVYAEARANPERFPSLVARWSEHPDRGRGGDFGSWSARGRTFFARELDLLSHLQPGEVGAPLDTAEGFQVIQRVQALPRKTYAMTAVSLEFDPLLPDAEPASRASVFARASELARLLREDPSRFEALQREYCCVASRQWLQGQDEPGALTTALERLEIGQISPEPVRDFRVYAIPLRIEPTPSPAPLEVEVPAPEHVDLLDVVRRTAYSGAFAEESMRQALSASRDVLGLSVEQLSALDALYSQLSTSSEPDGRERSYRSFLENARSLIGEERLARVLHVLTQHFDQYYMGD